MTAGCVSGVDDRICRGLVLSFFFNDTATTEIYTLSLHDALPICLGTVRSARVHLPELRGQSRGPASLLAARRSEEHTSELQSRPHLVCRLLLEKKKTNLTLDTSIKHQQSVP